MSQVPVGPTGGDTLAVEANADEARPSSARSTLGGRVAVISFIFVIFSLAALTLIPIVTSLRLDELRSETDSELQGPGRILRELRILMSDEFVALQTFRLTGDQAALTRYRAIREREEELIQELREAVQPVGGEAVANYERAREQYDRWHALSDSLSESTISEAEFVNRLPGMLPVRDSLISASDEAEREIEIAITAFEAAGVRLVVTQRSLSIALGMLALIAAVTVAGAAVRERNLTRELARAMKGEVRLRRAADQRREELQTVTASKARLMRGFSHDVKNPLGAADGYLQLLEAGVPEPVTSGQRSFIEKARRSMAAALNLIEDLLDIERASTGNIKIEWGPTDLSDVVREAVDEYRAQTEAKGLELNVALAATESVITTDRNRVRQVLGNLISNAVKYTPSGSVSVLLDRRTDPQRPEAGDSLVIEISDTGIGIPPEKIHLVFQEFVRFEPGVAKGTGIGLAISYRIVQALGGDLRMESESGRGSRFVLWLPTAAKDQTSSVSS